eukprot:CAMPEP_0175046500 /NCGR_PEP_ID=MMETSP0052_2-20121109/5066_1 /TAXON_ID=51329 ORGANISM="Polytomella parva, Strain SAG 63-3" /NCGR_SAMPLE_ID=MMETSP0052_2 /ASSEMBLY_ACC=CAM_ASM_000194 /LENGTH=480 /DNA_ID=CAMNT_0016310255 /DNA_START=175 /DNA_END=1613 /DNA_ORIENTATION=+
MQTNIRQDDKEWEKISSLQEEEASFLKQIAGVDDLRSVVSFQLSVAYSANSLLTISELMPNLVELNINSSALYSLRDLGNSFDNLQILWVSRCGLTSLEGLISLPNLKELYASYNDISNLQYIESCPSLEVLDLEGNCISDMDNIEYLLICNKLINLTLSSNPISQLPDYRSSVLKILPDLKFFDDEPIAVCATLSDDNLVLENAKDNVFSDVAETRYQAGPSPSSLTTTSSSPSKPTLSRPGSSASKPSNHSRPPSSGLGATDSILPSVSSPRGVRSRTSQVNHSSTSHSTDRVSHHNASPGVNGFHNSSGGKLPSSPRLASNRTSRSGSGESILSLGSGRSGVAGGGGGKGKGGKETEVEGDGDITQENRGPSPSPSDSGSDLFKLPLNLDLISEGIKRARVGIHSQEFLLFEMSSIIAATPPDGGSAVHRVGVGTAGSSTMTMMSHENIVETPHDYGYTRSKSNASKPPSPFPSSSP